MRPPRLAPGRVNARPTRERRPEYSPVLRELPIGHARAVLFLGPPDRAGTLVGDAMRHRPGIHSGVGVGRTMAYRRPHRKPYPVLAVTSPITTDATLSPFTDDEGTAR